MNQLDVGGRVAVVTGGASGIGLAIARRLLDSGARVSLWDASAGALESVTVSPGATLSPSKGAPPHLPDAHTAVVILVANAGVLWLGPIDSTPLKRWQLCLDVNLTGTFNCARAVVEPMRAADYGRIVNIASVAGKEGNPNAAAYSASKAGVIALTKSLGKELATTGIRVNCVTPAAVESPMFAQMTQAHIDYMLSKIPMNRFGTVDEIAALVAWLCTEECSFSTGAVFDLSGGRSTY